MKEEEEEEEEEEEKGGGGGGELEKKKKKLSFNAQSTMTGISRRKISEHQLTVQELCESRGGRPGLSVLTSLLVSVDVKNY